MLILKIKSKQTCSPFKKDNLMNHGNVIERKYYNTSVPKWLSGKEYACQCRRHGFNPLVRRSPGGGNGNSPQNSCLDNPIDRGAWRAHYGVTKESDTAE